MPVEIKLPQLGESIHEGTIARWLKKPGDRVEKYEPLVEINTDKVNVEMPSPFEGVLVELLAAEGDVRPVGSPIALIETSAAAPAAAADAAPAARGVGPRLSPLVRRLAEAHRIPLSVLETLPGSGAGGRITKEDVLQYVARGAGPPVPAAAPAAPAVPPAAPAAPAVPAAPAAPGDEVVRLSPIRRTIAQRMAQSKREIPHAYGVIEVDMSAVVAWREAHKEAWRRDAIPLTYTAFFVRAACEALRAYPIVNAAWSEDGII
ncbi:MAG: biotin/lipoyl-containing protein, partial [Armatimonadota bacterium]|nr:biotin/lipoyl-containing protein [Armatimonadota bacterium]